MRAFAITSTIEEQRAIVRCEGELDLETSADADSHLRKVEDAEVSEIVLDLRMLEFMDSTGLRTILAADSRARRDGRRLLLVRGPESVHRVFRIALLDQRLEFADPPGEGGPDV